jgi:hypothetical protein
VPAGSKKAPLYAHATVVDVKPTLVKIFWSDGAVSPTARLFAVRDPTQRASPLPRKEPPTRKDPAPRGPDPVVRTEPARAEPVRTEPARTEPARAEPARTEPAKVEMVPEPFPTTTPAPRPAAKGPPRQLVGTVTIASNVVQVVNTGAFDYTECSVRLMTNRSARIPLVARGAWVGLRPAEFKADPRPPDPQFAAGWSAVYCAEGTGYFHTTSR